MLHTLLGLMLLSTPALAGSELAEYTRLTQEIHQLAARNAWEGVERIYQDILATGIPPNAEEFVVGAQAARQLGNVNAARRRLELALEVLNIEELREWLHDINTAYGPVALHGDPKKVSLEVESMPFEPTKAAAIRYAQGVVAEAGYYEGLLPAGAYRFGPLSLEVRPGVRTERIDIRSDKYMRKLDRMARKREKNGDEASDSHDDLGGDPFYD